MFVDQALVRAEASLFIVYELLKTTIYQFHAQILPKTGRRRSGVNHLPLMILGLTSSNVYEIIQIWFGIVSHLSLILREF